MEHILLKNNETNVGKAGTITDKIMMAWKLYAECEDTVNKMKEIVKNHHIHLTDHGTILAVNELKNLNKIDSVLDEFKSTPEVISLIKEYAKNGIDSADVNSYEKELEKRIYIIFMRIFPEYCRQKASKDFIMFMKNPKNLSLIKEMFNIHGTVLGTEYCIDDCVRKMLNR